MKKVEKHKIRKNNKYFPFILEQLEQCKKISNSATFIIRQNFFFNKTKNSKGNEVRKYIKYNDMDRIFKRPNGECVNADINGSLQILSKVISTRLLEQLRIVVSSNGLALNPLKIAL